MPELPEVEVTRQSFAHAIAQGRIISVRMGKPLRWPFGIAEQRLVGQTVLDVRRRGKYLLLDLSDGMLLLHLGMSGSIVFQKQVPAAGVHDHFDLVTSHGTLRLHDPRRFGAVVFAQNEAAPEAHKLLGHLGVEPLGGAFDFAAFHVAMSRCKASVKQVLLAGKVVVGVGNIYACEALFMAGIRPTAKACNLSKPRLWRLHQAILEVLARAVEKGGSTLRDFSNAQGEVGHFQLEAKVYGRAGQACLQCSRTIKAVRQGQRSTFYCAHCQKP